MDVRFSTDAKTISSNRSSISDPCKHAFIKNSAQEMKNKTLSLSQRKWFKFNPATGEIARNYLFLYRNDCFEYFLSCMYCICYASSSCRSKLCKTGLKITEKTQIEKALREHENSDVHLNSAVEYNRLDVALHAEAEADTSEACGDTEVAQDTYDDGPTQSEPPYETSEECGDTGIAQCSDDKGPTQSEQLESVQTDPEIDRYRYIANAVICAILHIITCGRLIMN